MRGAIVRGENRETWLSLVLMVASVAIVLRCESATAMEPNQVNDYASLMRYVELQLDQLYEPTPRLDPGLSGLTYEQYRDIHFRHEKGVWAGDSHPFWLEFFHRGFVQTDRVEVWTIGNASRQRVVEKIGYDPDLFEYRGQAADISVPSDTGYAGVRIAGRFEPAGDPQELLTFVGSSYFRARTGQTVYGTSARGVAINVGMNQVEEFPVFRRFWIVEPADEDETCRVFAFLDGPSVVGGFQFTLQPGTQATHVDVKATLRLRKPVGKLAIAPLTSMWMWGDGLEGPPLDRRPHCHDSDGLLLFADDRWTWRPLARIPYPSVSSFPTDSLTGFGLLQRNRDFDFYRDSNAEYHRRPSVWVQFDKPWTGGRVELLELPGAHEGVDNIGAYFVIEDPPAVGDALEMDYDLMFFRDQSQLREHFSLETPHLFEFEQFSVERIDANERQRKQIRLRVILRTMDGDWPKDRPLPNLVVQTVRGNVRSSHVSRLEASERDDNPIVDTAWVPDKSRLVGLIELEPTEILPIEVRCYLVSNYPDAAKDEKVLSETFQTMVPVNEPEFVYPAVYTRIESSDGG